MPSERLRRSGRTSRNQVKYQGYIDRQIEEIDSRRDIETLNRLTASITAKLVCRQKCSKRSSCIIPRPSVFPPHFRVPPAAVALLMVHLKGGFKYAKYTIWRYARLKSPVHTASCHPVSQHDAHTDRFRGRGRARTFSRQRVCRRRHLFPGNIRPARPDRLQKTQREKRDALAEMIKIRRLRGTSPLPGLKKSPVSTSCIATMLAMNFR